MNFNPRTPVGCDTSDTLYFCYRDISIHAPQWGATGRKLRLLNMQSEFQSTHPSGVRPALLMPHNWPFQFQSTHPSGVRLHAPCSFARRWYFNPRTPVGCDFGHDLAVAVVVISIHAPQWGATAMSRQALQRMKFQSTHPSGVRPGSNRRLAYLVLISIHAPQWGATMPWPSILPTTAFQSTHPSGVRLDAGDGTGHVLVISIHAPQWGATSWLSKIVVAFINFNPRTPVGCDT